MAPRLRRMKPYHPRRRRSKGTLILKQSLADLKHKISGDVGSLIAMLEEGNVQQIPSLQQKAKSDLLKHRDEMQKIAEKMGERCAKAVRDYLDSVDVIIHTNPEWLDAEKIRNCFTMTQKLEKEIGAA